MITRLRTAAPLMLLIVTGCSMRITGVVTDESTGNPIGGAVVSAYDGRNRHSTTDPVGRFNVKTDSDTKYVTVTAPNYETVTVEVPAGSRVRAMAVSIRPLSPRAATAAAVVDPQAQPAGHEERRGHR
jgi:hypothetical protein